MRDVAEPQITTPEQALIRPVAVACCDLDVAVADRRVLVVGRLSIGLYAAALAAAYGAHVDYVDTDPSRLAAAEKLGALAHDRAKPDKSWDPYPVTVHTSADPSLLAATLRATWPDGVCTDTGIYYQGGVEMPLLTMYTRGVRFVTGRVNARAVIPEVLELLAGCDLSPAVDRIVPWDDAAEVWPTMTGKTVSPARRSGERVCDLPQLLECLAQLGKAPHAKARSPLGFEPPPWRHLPVS